MTLKLTVRRITMIVGVGLVAAAVVTELRKPAGQRTWQGEVAGVVPYNFRPSGRSRITENSDHADHTDDGTDDNGSPDADSDKLLVPRDFGVGWTVNVPEVMRRLRDRRFSAS